MASGQLEVLTTWKTFYASTYWNMRFSVAGAAMDAHVRMFRMTSCFATGPEILLWWEGNLTPTPTTRPTLLVGAPTARLRWTPLVRFEAPLGLIPHMGCLVFFRLVLFVGLCFRFVKCFGVLSAVSFVSFSFYHITLCVAFSPE